MKSEEQLGASSLRILLTVGGTLNYYLRVAPNACQTFTDACGLIELNPGHRSHVLPRARESEALQALPELRQYNPGFCTSPLELRGDA